MKLELYEHFCDIFISGTTDERKDFMENCKEVIDYADRRNNDYNTDTPYRLLMKILSVGLTERKLTSLFSVRNL